MGNPSMTYTHPQFPYMENTNGGVMGRQSPYIGYPMMNQQKTQGQNLFGELRRRDHDRSN